MLVLLIQLRQIIKANNCCSNPIMRTIILQAHSSYYMKKEQTNSTLHSNKTSYALYLVLADHLDKDNTKT